MRCLICGFLLIVFFSVALLGHQDEAKAQISDVQSITVNGVSRAVSPSDAVKEATSQAVLTQARKQVVDVLGEAAYSKDKAQIEKKIVRQSTRFIPFVNPGEPQQMEDGSWKVPVEMSVSPSSLRKLLLDEGFVAASSNESSLVPLVAFTDRTKAQSLRWWMGDPAAPDLKLLTTLQTVLHSKMSEEFSKQNLVYVKPPTDAPPETLRIERPSSQDLTAIAAWAKAAMIVRGDVRVVPSNVQGAGTVTVKLQVVQASTPDRVLAEVVREFNSDRNAASLEVGLRNKALSEFTALSKDLATQVQGAWQRGTVGTNYINLTVRGPLNSVQQLAFKTAFVRNVHEVRDLKERLFEHGMVTYEADFAGDLTQFANRIKTLRLGGFDVNLAGQQGGRSLVLDVKPNSSVN